MKLTRKLAATVFTIALGVASLALAQSFYISEIDRPSSGHVTVRHDSGTSFYYILYGGTNVPQMFWAKDMALGLFPEGSLQDNVGTNSVANFYHVLRIPISQPDDTDGDGIDDVWELLYRFPGAALNPLDAYEDHTGSGTPDIIDYLASLPLVAWFPEATSEAYIDDGNLHIPVHFSRPVTGTYAYEIRGDARSGRDFMPLSGVLNLSQTNASQIHISMIQTQALQGVRSLVLTLKTPASNVLDRVEATPSEGNPQLGRFSSHTITIRSSDQGFYVGNLIFLSETTRLVENGQTNVTITPAPAIAPSTLRMAVRGGPTPRVDLEFDRNFLLPDRISLPITIHQAPFTLLPTSAATGQTVLPGLGGREVSWQLELLDLQFTEAGSVFEGECRITLQGLTASGLPRILRGRITASREDI